MAEITVTVYTTPACPGCRMTKWHMDKLGIHYTEVPILIGDFAEAFAELELQQAPVVCASVDGNETYWGGYRPDRIDALKEAA